MNTIKDTLPRAVICIAIFTAICGIIYTLTVTAAAQIIFPDQANGSIIEVGGKKYGCELLGQQYTDEAHMWSRIMNIDTGTFTDDQGNRLMYGWASNLSPASDEFAALVKERVEKIRLSHPEKGDVPVPVDLVTCSGSGLDPDISLAAAEYQVERVARNNGMSSSELSAIIEKCTNHRIFGIFGEETVNVLKVNLMLDGILK